VRGHKGAQIVNIEITPLIVVNIIIFHNINHKEVGEKMGGTDLPFLKRFEIYFFFVLRFILKKILSLFEPLFYAPFFFTYLLINNIIIYYTIYY
tara:strand:- start:4161 stop:4442 length:282 start_codon:yes stop_codon:yes gene_type:complete